MAVNCMKKLMKVALSGITLLTVPSVKYAATYLSAFSLSLPGLNQSVSTGLGQSKATSGANGQILVTVSKQKFDARQTDEQGNSGDWRKQISKGDTAGLPGNSNQLKGDKMKLTISSNWNATTDSKNGSWKSN